MMGKKNILTFVNTQTDMFFSDFESSRKNIKLFTSFSKEAYLYDKSKFNVADVKLKFKPSIKTRNSKILKGGIF